VTTYRTPVDPVVIVGAGPAGLATAYALQRRGVTARILEKNDRAGASWETYYDALRLNSGRVVSSLPGMRIDRRYGRWVGRDDFIAYLRRYAASLAAPTEFGVSVDRIDRAGHCWSIQTSNGPMRARAVVVATGLNAVASTPHWATGASANNVLHSRHYRNSLPYRGRTVLVVGAGASAHDIALDLTRGGATQVWMSVRTPPLLVPRQIFGVSSSVLAMLIKHGPSAPGGLIDAASKLLHHAWFPDAQRLLGTPPVGLASASRDRGHGVTVEVGVLDAVRSGDVTILPGVAGLDDGTVTLDDGRRLHPDAIILATGQRPALEKMVGPLGVLDDRGMPLAHAAKDLDVARNLFFVGFRLPAGQLPDLRIDARAIARRIARPSGRC